MLYMLGMKENSCKAPSGKGKGAKAEIYPEH